MKAASTEIESDRTASTIVGGGLVAGAFAEYARRIPGSCIFASGVSNSACTDQAQFERERRLLGEALTGHASSDRFVYFSTCSVDDPAARGSGYVLHKLAMEAMVRGHPGHLIVRLPQVAGRTRNPYTLLNYLRDRIVSGEQFQVWGDAQRNVIDIEDVARIVTDLILVENARAETLNVANPANVQVLDIVAKLEEVLDRKGMYAIVQRGDQYAIDTQRIAAAIGRTGIPFEGDYLHSVLHKYYAAHATM